MRSFFKMYKKILNLCIIGFVFIYLITSITNRQLFGDANEKIISIILFISYTTSILVDYILEYVSSIDEVENYYETIRGSVRLSNNKAIAFDDLKKTQITTINDGNEENTSKSPNSDDSSDIMELMLLNMKEIKEYYVLSKNMAKKAFTLSVIMCILGVVIIFASIIAIFAINISLTQSIIPIIGGTVIEVIAATSLTVYKKSLEQLNQYYESLHNNERFLSLVNLIDKLSEDKKDETYINIINNQLEALKQ